MFEPLTSSDNHILRFVSSSVAKRWLLRTGSNDSGVYHSLLERWIGLVDQLQAFAVPRTWKPDRVVKPAVVVALRGKS